GDWKLLVMPPPYASGQAELYNVAQDPGETNDRARDEPQRLESLLRKWQQYREENGVILPDWVSGY
ncbi:MAG: arylsulfatase, partial [Gammaproteobacteria bacterium]|nr:arylsulfatase [Gammaproteobacteria bacterium]